jgi:hypothetical protein
MVDSLYQAVDSWRGEVINDIQWKIPLYLQPSGRRSWPLRSGFSFVELEDSAMLLACVIDFRLFFINNLTP